MRVLMDGFWWFDGPASNRMVLHEMTRAWAHRYPDDELVVAVPGRRRRPEGPSSVGGSVSEARTLLRLHPAVNRLEMPVIALRLGADAVLAHNFAVPHRAGAVYLYDVIFQTNPEWFTWMERRYFSLMPRMARRAAVVFTETRAERRRILACNPDLASVVVTGLAPAAALSSCDPTPPPLGLTEGCFLLTVGRLNARKNLERTVDAALLSGTVGPECPLVIVGSVDGRGPGGMGRIAAAAAAGLVVATPSVTTAELAWLYRNCRAFVYLSLAEGFGLPPVEAAALGAPVVASDLDVFRETLRTSATFVDPLDPPAVADALRAVVAAPPPAPPLRATGWGDIVEVIRGRLARLAAGGRPGSPVTGDPGAAAGPDPTPGLASVDAPVGPPW